MKFLVVFAVVIALVASKAYKKDERIVGGQIADPHMFPFQAVIVVKKSAKVAILCGGSLVTDKTVLTAAHCLFGSNDALVILGGHDLAANETETERQFVERQHFRLHPEFNIQVAHLDIALIMLVTAVKYSAFIQPLKLPSGFLFEESFTGEIGTISGYGQHCDSCGTSQLLRFTKNRVMSNEECSKKFNFNAIPSDTQICLSTADSNNGNCRGDSGGPVTIQRDDTPIQIGISSFGYRKCEQGEPTVFTRLTRELVTWIKQEIQKENDIE